MARIEPKGATSTKFPTEWSKEGQMQEIKQKLRFLSRHTEELSDEDMLSGLEDLAKLISDYIERDIDIQMDLAG